VRRQTRDVWLLYLTLAVGKAVLSIPFQMPLVWGDAFLYLNRAWNLATGGLPILDNMCGPNYPPLYSILIAPAFLANPPVEVSYHLVLVINALLSSLIAFPAYSLLRLHGLNHRRSLLVTALISLMSGSLSYSFTVMAENALAPMTVWFLLLLFRYSRCERSVALVTGLVLGCCALTKGLAYSYIPAFILVGVMAALEKKSNWRSSAGSLFVALTACFVPIIAWQGFRVGVLDNHFVEYPEEYPITGYVSVIQQVFSDWDVSWRFLRIASNQISYLFFGSFGLAAVALYSAIRQAIRKVDRPANLGFLALFAGVVALGTVHSTFYFPSDQMRYTLMGRYADVLIPGLALIGIVELERLRKRPGGAWFFTTILLLGGLCAYKIPWLSFGIMDRVSLTYANGFIARMPFRLFFVVLAALLIIAIVQYGRARFEYSILVAVTLLLSLLSSGLAYRSQVTMSRELYRENSIGRFIRESSSFHSRAILMARSDFRAHACFRPQHWMIIYETRTVPTLIDSFDELTRFKDVPKVFLVSSRPRIGFLRPVAAQADFHLFELDLGNIPAELSQLL
jgi:hypothetical protein